VDHPSSVPLLETVAQVRLQGLAETRIGKRGKTSYAIEDAFMLGQVQDIRQQEPGHTPTLHFAKSPQEIAHVTHAGFALDTTTADSVPWMPVDRARPGPFIFPADSMRAALATWKRLEAPMGLPMIGSRSSQIGARVALPRAKATPCFAAWRCLPVGSRT
jgi:hypothetical protein